MVKPKRLEAMGEIVSIDQLVRLYNGAYTHDEIFNLSIDEIYTFKYIHLLERHYSDREAQIRKELKPKPKKK